MPCDLDNLKAGDTVLVSEDVGEHPVNYSAPYTLEVYNYRGKTGKVTKVFKNSVDLRPVQVLFEDCNYYWFNPEDLTVVVEKEVNTYIPSAVVSDGGSSEYYQKIIPKHMLDRWNETGKIEAKDVMRLFLNNDFNMSNVFKAHCRVIDLRNGRGKLGADEKYDLKKAVFFSEDELQNYLGRISD
jgi:hypothetical protein